MVGSSYRLVLLWKYVDKYSIHEISCKWKQGVVLLGCQQIREQKNIFFNPPTKDKGVTENMQEMDIEKKNVDINNYD